MEENLQEIQILIKEYPYYSLLYFKHAKLLSGNKNDAYKNALKLASIYAPNRRKLQEFIENPTDYRKQIVIHPEWLSESNETHAEEYTLNMNDEELIKEILTLEEKTHSIPVQETPIVNEVYEIEEILSHFTEETSAQNNTMQEIEKLKQTIQQNQEKARLALFQSNYTEKTATHSANITAEHVEEPITAQEIITENIEEQTLITNEVEIPKTKEEINDVLTTEIQQEPVSLNVPKMKEWFEQELKAVRSEKEEKENAQVTPKTEKEEMTLTEDLKIDEPKVSAEGYMSWLDELLRMESSTKKTKNTQTNVDKKALQESIIDKFLQNQPKMSKPNVIVETPVIEDKTESQNVEYEDIASETLAKIFVMQKQYDRAIRIYRVLMSKNPQQKKQYEEIIQEIESKMN